MKDVALFLCNLTMHAAQPWHDAGYHVVLVDPQHPAGVHTVGRVTRVGCRLDAALVYLGGLLRSGRVAFVAGFPVCTDVALSGTKHWARKFQADRYFQARAAILAEQCRTIGELSGAPWYFENPKSAFSMIFGAPQHKFHPFHFTALEPADNYTKDTWLWTGGGFVMPEPCVLPSVAQAVAAVTARCGRLVAKPDVLDMEWPEAERALLAAWYPDDRIHKAAPSKKDPVARANFRSATPRGWSLASFACNGAPLPVQRALEWAA